MSRHLHIPLQTGNDRLLKDNNRPYTKEYYYQKVKKIKELIPDISISSDVIVGLPSETDQEFEETTKFIEKCELSFLHVFPYARKKFTVDYDKKGQVAENIKRERVGSLTKTSERLYNTYMGKFLSQSVDVLFEKQQDGYLIGHCSQYIVIKVRSDEDLLNKIHKVYIDKVDGDLLYGHLI